MHSPLLRKDLHHDPTVPVAKDSSFGELASLLLTTCDGKNLRGGTCVYTYLGSLLALGQAVPCPGPLSFFKDMGLG